MNLIHKIKESITLKVLIILGMILLLLIPNALIQELINERQGRKAQIERDVARAYGKEQTIQPYILRIPYEHTKLNTDNKPYTTNGFICINPSNVEINGTVKTDLRERSIYEIVVYNANLTIEQAFDWAYFNPTNWESYTFDFENAHLLIGIGDTNGLQDSIGLTVNNEQIKLKGNAEFSSPLDMQWLETNPFKVTIDEPIKVASNLLLKGTKALYIEPIGEQLKVQLESPWAHPSFTGSQLPVNHDITEAGFTANWTTNAFIQKYPRVWFNNLKDIERYGSFGVKLIQPIDEYGKNFRTSKYALLIITLTFGIFFFFEILFKKMIHPIQYTLVGFALTVFYLLLLSITEHLGFDWAYLISAIATISLIVTYTHFILKTVKGSSILLLLLSSLFGYVFVILQMQDFALLAGAIALFVILAFVMILSRNIDWYNLSKPQLQENLD